MDICSSDYRNYYIYLPWAGRTDFRTVKTDQRVGRSDYLYFFYGL